MKMIFDDELEVLLLFKSLPDSWDTLMVSLKNSPPQGVSTLDIVKDNMFNEKTRRKNQETLIKDETLVVKYHERSNTRNFHNRDKSKDKFRGKYMTRKDLKCYHCGEICHMK